VATFLQDMQQYPTHVIKRLTCPNCGTAEKIRFGFFEVRFEAPCPDCGVIIRWKRKPDRSGGLIRQAFDDYEPEIAPPPRRIYR
jgi:predicted RNA-binding Zn-ribbon protein involved in translation (DUF1610 family)